MKVRLRRCVFRAGLPLFAACLLALGACADLPTDPHDPPTHQTSAAGPRYACDIMVGKVYVMCPVSPNPTDCDKYTSLDWCQDDSGGECISSMSREERYTPSGCPGPGGGGGAGGGPGAGAPGGEPPGPTPTDPDDPALQPDTCTTNDPVIDDPVVEQLFTNLWTSSNPSAEQSQRVEQAAWIVQTPTGLATLPWTDADFAPCAVTPHYGSFQIPANAIGWVHTHPFTQGELQTSCDPIGYGSDGGPIYATYNSWPNANDIGLASAINDSLGRRINAYTIDSSRIMRFVAVDASAATGVTPYSRCGY